MVSFINGSTLRVTPRQPNSVLFRKVQCLSVRVRPECESVWRVLTKWFTRVPSKRVVSEAAVGYVALVLTKVLKPFSCVRPTWSMRRVILFPKVWFVRQLITIGCRYRPNSSLWVNLSAVCRRKNRLLGSLGKHSNAALSIRLLTNASFDKSSGLLLALGLLTARPIGCKTTCRLPVVNVRVALVLTVAPRTP